MGMGFPIFARALERGLAPSLGCDIVSNNRGDLFAQMRLGLQAERARANQARLDDLDDAAGAHARRARRAAVRDARRGEGARAGRRCAARSRSARRADLVVLRTDGLHLSLRSTTRSPDRGLQAGPADVDTVLVGGAGREGGRRAHRRRARRAARSLAEAVARPHRRRRSSRAAACCRRRRRAGSRSRWTRSRSTSPAPGSGRMSRMKMIDLSAPIENSPAELLEPLTDGDRVLRPRGGRRACRSSCSACRLDLLRDGEGWATEEFTPARHPQLHPRRRALALQLAPSAASARSASTSCRSSGSSPTACVLDDDRQGGRRGGRRRRRRGRARAGSATRCSRSTSCSCAPAATRSTTELDYIARGPASPPRRHGGCTTAGCA